MTKYFFDTEFIESGPNFPLQLISIGMVCEDGREYYAQVIDVDWDNAVPWVQENVINKLVTCDLGDPQYDKDNHVFLATLGYICAKKPCHWRTRQEIADELLKFCTQRSNPEFWAYFADYDWVLFCQLFGKMVEMPPGFPHMCMDIRQYQKHLRVDALPAQDEGGHHNALDDARWNVRAWNHLNAVERVKQWSK